MEKNKKNNMRFYEEGRKVPREALTPITSGRLAGKSNINPMYRIKMLTQMFGPAGIGWYTEVTKQWIEESKSGSVGAFVNLRLYIRTEEGWSAPIEGTGGAQMVAIERNGPYFNDEAFKMAETDAISVACKKLGIGADVHWESDSNKYSSYTEQTQQQPRVQSKPAAQPVAKGQTAYMSRPQLNEASPNWKPSVTKAAKAKISPDEIRKLIENSFTITDQDFNKLMIQAGKRAS